MSTTLSSSAGSATAPQLSGSAPQQLWWHRETALRNLLILGFFLLGLWYSLATPPFETPDELYHYGFVRHIAQGNGLPVQEANVESPWEQEGSQAPLYYLLVGWLTSGIDQSDFDQLNIRNPRANIGDPLFPGNKNFMLYSAASHPLRGANLALHIGRWLSLLLGMVTLWATYALARFAVQGQRHARLVPLIVTAYVAAIPQFVFISASCSNDSLIIAASALTLYWLGRLLTKPKTTPILLYEWLVLGILLGVAALSKLQGLGLVGLAGLVVLWLAWQRQNWRLLLHTLLPVALPFLFIAGWWYWRNLTLYGDLFGTSYLLANNGQRTDELTWTTLWGELRGLRYSFWGLFGWFNLLLPGWIYTLLDSITVIGLMGMVARLVSYRQETRERHSIRLLALVWTLLSLMLLAYWISQATGSQGRLLFPAIGAIIYLLVDGLAFWIEKLPAPLQLPLWSATPLLLVGASIYTLLVLYPHAYGALQTVDAMPETVTPVDIRYRGIAQPSDEIRVLGLTMPTERYRPGERVPVSLYLQAEQVVEDDYQLFIQLLNEEGREIGNLTSHPGWGRYPTTLWQPGSIYVDTYPVLIDQPIDNRSPLLANLYIGFVNPATEKSGRFPITALDGAGNEIPEPFLGQVAVSPTTVADVADLATADTDVLTIGTQFGTVIQLSAVALPAPAIFADAVATQQPFTVTLLWDALGTPATEYAAFLHLVGRTGEQATGFDQAPAPRFPTSYWQVGDRIISTFVVPAPPSGELDDYAIWVGLYEAGSGGAVRLPVTDPAGQVAGDGQVLVRDRVAP